MSSHLWRRLACAAALAVFALSAASAQKDKDDEKTDPKEQLARARKVAAQELQEQVVVSLASRLAEMKLDTAKFLEENIAFSPTSRDFTLDAHVYMDLPDTYKIRLALRAVEQAKPGMAELTLAVLSRVATVTELERDPRRLALENPREILTGYLDMRKAINPKFDIKESTTSRIPFAFPKPPARPELTEDVRGRIAVLARYLSDPRNGAFITLQRYFRKTPDQAADMLWKYGSLQAIMEKELSGLEDFEELFEKLVNKVNLEAKRNKDDSIEKAAILWPKRKPGTVKGIDDLPAAVKRAGAKIQAPPTPNLKPEDRAAEYNRLNKDCGSLQPKLVRKRTSYPAGVFFAGTAKAEELPKPTKLRYEADKADVTKGKLIVTFKDKSERTLGGVGAEEARAAWDMIFGKDAAKAGDGIPLLGLEDGGGNYYDITKTNIRRGERRSVVAHPALLDTELGAAAMWLEVAPNNRVWLRGEIATDPSMGTKESRARKIFETLSEWTFDPWRNLDIYYGGRRQSVFRLTDVPLVIRKGSEDGSLRVARDTEDFDDWTRGRVFVEMSLMVQQVDDDGKPKGDIEEVTNCVRQSYLVISDLLQTSPELQRLNNFAAVLGVARWAKGQGAVYAEPEKPKAGQKTPESLGIFADLVVPLARLKPNEVRPSEEKRLIAKMDELTKTAGMKKYARAWEKFWEAHNNQDDTDAATEARVTLEVTDQSVAFYARIVRAVYVDKVEGFYAKHRDKNRKVDKDKVKADFGDLIEALKKETKKKPAETGIAIFMLEEMGKRLFKDDA